MIGTDWEGLERRWRAFWARENDTPLLGLTAPKEGAAPFVYPRAHRSVAERWHDIDHRIAQARHGMESTYFGGDAFPMAFPDLGPHLRLRAELRAGHELGRAVRDGLGGLPAHRV